jgi:hypothetical protein
VKVCERCGREMDDDYRIAGEDGVGGNCADCGDTLCAACGRWAEDGRCSELDITLDAFMRIYVCSIQPL